MARTYAPNGIYLGMFAGLLAGVATENAAVGITALIAVSVAGWYGIRALEKLLGRGVEAGFNAAVNFVQNAKPPSQHPMQSPAPYPTQGAQTQGTQPYPTEPAPYPTNQQFPTQQPPTPPAIARPPEAPHVPWPPAQQGPQS